MKLAIDLRQASLTNDLFCTNFINDISKKIQHHDLVIYSNSYFENINNYNCIWYKWFFWNQVLFLKKLYQDNNDLVITFNDNFPILYKKKFIQVITSLENLLYPNHENSTTFKKHGYTNILKNNLKRAEKILCFDDKTKKDINEKLNIDEDKIDIIPAFFSKIEEKKAEIELKIDIKQKHSLNNPYFIYDSGTWTNKNLKRLFEAIAKVNASLIIIWNHISNDIEIRELIIRLWVKDKIIFAWIPDEKELAMYYKNSSWVIFPLLYSSFPFSLNNAINFWNNILASNIEEIRNIFWDNITYFSPTSTYDIIECLEKNLNMPNNNNNYSDILKKYNNSDFTNNLIKLCQI